jgi:nitroimidazol reductase NimA-like FMN-containing flavoprotein (pyridoxamine 5'-phosphate oxidase superfamily)
VRIGDQVYVHAASGGRIARTLSSGPEVWLTVTLIDGSVLARSAFHHSMNYRSVIAFGRVRLVEDPAEKMDTLRHFTNPTRPAGGTRCATRGERIADEGNATPLTNATPLI